MLLMDPEEGQPGGLLGLGLPQAPGAAIPAGAGPGAMATLQADPAALHRAGAAIQALQGRPATAEGGWQDLWDRTAATAQQIGHPAGDRLADEQVAFYRQPE